MRKLSRLLLGIIILSAIASFAQLVGAHSGHNGVDAKAEAISQLVPRDVARAAVACDPQLGMAGTYPCKNVDLLSVVPTVTLSQGGTGNDIWGWTDEASGREFAIMGHSLGTSFTEVTDPENATYLGYLPSGSIVNALWRDMKVYNDHVYVVADFSQAQPHGLQVFDLTNLLGTPPLTGIYAETNRLNTFDEAHNIAINEETGIAYAVGSDICAGGLYMIDLADPANPVEAGCFDADGYTHDVQCVNYHGPDVDFQGQEICMAANEDTLTIVDVTDKEAPVQLGRMDYMNSADTYSHQGWLTEDHAYFLLGDELDEQNLSVNTRTFIWDVRDLNNPSLIGIYSFDSVSIDHNLYVKDGLLYEANYTDGLRILDLTDVKDGVLKEVGFLDTVPGVDVSEFAGSWSVYPYFESGTVIVSNIEEGLFVLRPTLPNLSAELTANSTRRVGPGEGDTVTYSVTITNSGTVAATDLVVTNTVNSVEYTLSGVTTIPVGESAEFTHDYIVQSADCNGLSATARATSAEGSGAGTNLPTTTEVACSPTFIDGVVAYSELASPPILLLFGSILLLTLLLGISTIHRRFIF